MGAHSASGHLPGSRITATAGIAAAVVTTATTGVLAGGTAFATDGHGGSGHSHAGERASSEHHGAEQASSASAGFAEQTLCDVLGDVDLGGNGSCSSDDGGTQQPSSDRSDGNDGSDGDSAASSPGLFGSRSPDRSGQQTSAPDSAPQAAPTSRPASRPTSSVPDKPTVQPITAAPSTSKIMGGGRDRRIPSRR